MVGTTPLPRARAGNESRNDLRRGGLHVEVDVTVRIQGDADVRVAESFLHDPRVDARAQRQRRVGMPEIVQPAAGNPIRFDSRTK